MDCPTIGSLVREAGRRYASLPFIIDGDRRSSFADFDREVDRLCAGLLRLGVRRGDHVGIWLPNIPEWVLFFAAAGRLGAVAVPVNTRYKADEARYIIAQSDATILVMLPRMWQTDYYDMLVSMAPELPSQPPGQLSLQAFPRLRSVIMVGGQAPPGTTPLASLISEDRAEDRNEVRQAEAEVSPCDMLLICYTSGTTGKPKGVMHNHGVIRQSTKVGLALHAEPGDKILGHMPFYHSAGLFMAIIPAMALGMALVPMLQWDPDRALELIARERITAFGGIPTHYYDLVGNERLKDADTTSLKAAWIGGSAVMQETFENIKRALKLDRLLSTYGMTENTISTSFNAWDDPAAICCQNLAPLLADCEVAIVDPETGKECPAGREGEIWCRGDTVMMGYYKDPEATRATVTGDGWLRTGDLGRMDEKRYLMVTGRLKELLKIGGTNTSPIEIEQHLAGYPGIQSSVVVGAPDARLGQVAYAFVQVAPKASLTPPEVIRFCQQRMADYKVPRYVKFVEEFPRTATGKIQRAVLAREAHREIAGPDTGGS